MALWNYSGEPNTCYKAGSKFDLLWVKKIFTDHVLYAQFCLGEYQPVCAVMIATSRELVVGEELEDR